VRDRFLKALVLSGISAALITESLSVFHWIGRPALIVAWGLILVAFAWWSARNPLTRSSHPIRPLEATITACIAAIIALLALTAWLSPPNTFDALAYHMPRVVYWTQSGSVAFFPSPYLSQISAPPLDEYLKLHVYVLAGGDRLVNLVSVAAFAACVVGASAIAGELGLNSKGQAFAAILCATLPSGVLQASGPKNDCLTALWLVCLVYFAIRTRPAFLGLSLGLALATKGTAYLFAPPLLAGALWIAARQKRRALPWLPCALWVVSGVLLANGPHFARNFAFSGSPLGYDAPFDDGRFRWRNENPGWRVTVSDVLRHVSEQLGSGNPRWNRGEYDLVLRAHNWLKLDPQGEGSPPWSRFTEPSNTRHEANANNRWHLLLFLIASAGSVWLVWRRREPEWFVFSCAVSGGFLLFCWYLRWQPYSARLFLPLFVLGTPLSGGLLSRIKPAFLGPVVCLLLLDGARLPVLANWTRPLRGPHNLFVTSRSAAYFLDLPIPGAEESYRAAVDAVARSGCHAVGIDIGENQLEYPFQALLLQRGSTVRFAHAGVTNSTLRFARPGDRVPCAVFCLQCAEVPAKTDDYSRIGPPLRLGRSVLFLANPPQ
jgi:hypothetical protein